MVGAETYLLRDLGSLPDFDGSEKDTHSGANPNARKD